MYLVILILLVLLFIGALPHWPYSTGLGYGYYPSGFLLIVIIILIVLMVR